MPPEPSHPPRSAIRASLTVASFLLLASAAAATAAATPWDGLTSHKAPSALAADAVTSDWPRFLGPADHPASPETRLIPSFSETGPPLVWECTRGESYASPAIAAGRLFLFHNRNSRETIDCLDAITGQRFWSHSYPIDYSDDFGYGSGPRSGPVVAGGKVITFGVTSRLQCRNTASGDLVWEHDCETDFGVPKYFFGSGASPLVHKDLVIVNLGGSEDRCVAAFDLATGKLRWMTSHAWGQSYASPISAQFHGKERILVFAGGKSDPATGGLLSIDPASGKPDEPFFWRARRYPSVNAASPVRCGPNRVFLSQAYIDRDSPCNGGVMLTMKDDQSWETAWKSEDLACHWTTPVYHDGHLYGFSGEKERSCQLVCLDAGSGALRWKKQFSFPMKSPDGQEIPVGLFRGSLLRVDGRFLCLGEWGTLCWLNLSPESATVGSHCQPFVATQSWTLPALSHGLLYVSQNEPDRLNGKAARLLCFDLRAQP